MNPKQMKKVMQSMGIKQEELDAEEVVIRLADREIVIHEPQVSRVTMMGQVTYQVAGSTEERSRSDLDADIPDEDVETVLSQAHVSEQEAKDALRRSGGDIAQAILDLTRGRQS
ncbi:nascent polypeptide-associated complex protein [Candidatus Woesearchaeota archaeon]|nr:nascent polypeptide-associated complex protein [Candidatus Woesearchaeota archaeon]